MQTKIEEIIEKLKTAKHIFIIGNGGSASLADHFACDLLKNCDLPAISLCSNQALITAIANDIDFDEIFVKQLEILFKEGDILVAFSTRGDSSNIIHATQHIYHNKVGTIISIAGFDGGELKKWSHIFYHIDSSDMQECEDKMLEFCHKIYKELKNGRE